MLVIHPEVVRMEYAKCEENPNKPGPFTRNPTSKDLTISVTGAWGNPTLASHEKGEIAIRTLKELIKTDLSHFFTLSQG
jgi:creatinine amidohydrolase